MTSVMLLYLLGEMEYHDKDSIKTSFPSFLKIIKRLENKLLIKAIKI